MGKEEEITRIARRLDKMVTKKTAVRGAGRQDPGTPAPPSPPSPRQGPGDYPRGRTRPRRWPSRDPCPGPALPITPHPRLGRHQAWTSPAATALDSDPNGRPGTRPSPAPAPDPAGGPRCPSSAPPLRACDAPA